MASSQATADINCEPIAEKTISITWPSVSATAWGQFLGRLYAIPYGVPIFNVGNLCILLSILVAVPLYLWNFIPKYGTRYRITSRRILIERGASATVEQALPLDGFDKVTVTVRSGQEWFRSADVTFSRGGEPVLDLPGVPYPIGFVKTCEQAQSAFQFSRSTP